MARNQIELRPTYWASFSGGKDSFYMIYYILNHLDKYPLDGVVHFELEIDFPFIKDVVDYVEVELKKYGIPMMRIKPRKTWIELFEQEAKSGIKYMYPTSLSRWCNDMYKTDSDRQLKSMMQAQGKRVIEYIGFCADEVKRFKFELEDRQPNVTQIYPLAEAGIMEDLIWQWAKNQPIYNDYYKFNRRCGCMGCPMASLSEFVYLKLYYPEYFDYFMQKAKETEEYRTKLYGRPISVWSANPKYNTDYKIRRVNEIIEQMNQKQMELFDYDDGNGNFRISESEG